MTSSKKRVKSANTVKNSSSAKIALIADSMSDDIVIGRRKYVDSMIFNLQIVRFIGYALYAAAVHHFLIQGSSNHNESNPDIIISHSGSFLGLQNYLVSPCLIAIAYLCCVFANSGTIQLKKAYHINIPDWNHYPSWRVYFTTLLLPSAMATYLGLAFIGSGYLRIFSFIQSDKQIPIVIGTIICLSSLTKGISFPSEMKTLRISEGTKFQNYAGYISQLIRFIWAGFLIGLSVLSILSALAGFGSYDALAIFANLLFGMILLFSTQVQDETFVISSMYSLMMCTSMVFLASFITFITISVEDSIGSYALLGILFSVSVGIYTSVLFLFISPWLGSDSDNQFHEEYLQMLQAAKKKFSEKAVSGFADDQ